MDIILQLPYSKEEFSVAAFTKIQPPCPIGLKIEVPNANITNAEKENVESMEKLKSALSAQDEQFCRMNDDTKKTGFIISGMFYEPSSISAIACSEISAKSEETGSELREIKSQLSSENTREKGVNIILQTLENTVKKVTLMVNKMNPTKRNNLANELLNIESTRAETVAVNDGNDDLSKANSQPMQSRNNTIESNIFLPGNANFAETGGVNAIRHTIVIKFLEMLLSAIYIFVLELQPKKMSYVFDICSRLICIFGFCGTLIILSNYIKNPNSASVTNLLKLDLVFCIFMFLSYIWLSFTIILTYHFYIKDPLSSLLVFGFLMQLIFFLDIKNILNSRAH